METGTVQNPTRFISTQTAPGYGWHMSPNDPENDPDIYFLRMLKGMRSEFRSSELILALPKTPLTPFHLHWLIALAETKPETRSIVQYIISTYQLSGEDVLLEYYKNKAKRFEVLPSENK
jgi:hypothetical protein